ncbi:hypothetical protein M9Y10_003109 [Tritrichomonas musculus]|uniref:Uncharacterized protein n=1 Tax=Tritrichomonas musculus TaxID=1915356 RepID=A0ABR2JNY9_9EUKA
MITLYVLYIFKSNKKTLLFLIEQQLIIVDEYIVKKITLKEKYQPFINEKWFPKYRYNDETNEEVNGWVKEINRELPENDIQICELIRKDMITEFVKYVTQNGVSLNAKIHPSIYETNLFLLNKKPRRINQNQIRNRNQEEEEGFTLIEYAVFFGSIKIFHYLQRNDVTQYERHFTLKHSLDSFYFY